MSIQRIATGINGLDELIQGGLPQGSTILVAGRPGCGKTTLGQQMMFHNAGRDFTCLYMTTLAEPSVKVMRFQQEFSFFDPRRFQESVIFAELGETLRTDGVEGALREIERNLHEHRPQLLVIDTFRTIADLISSPMQTMGFLIDLSLRLATWGCTTLLLGEYTEAEIDVRAESSIADGIIYLSGTEEKREQKRFLRIMKMRGTATPGGQSVFTITQDGISLFPRLKPSVRRQMYNQHVERLSTGLASLDEMTGGGIPAGSTTLVSGTSGTGKTLLALHFADAGLRSAEPVVYVTFEENPGQLVANGERLGLQLKRRLDDGSLHIVHVAPMELDVDVHVYQVQKRVAEIGAKRLVIDSISSFEMGVRDKVKYADYIWALTDFFKVQGVTVYMTHEIHDSAEVSLLTKHGISFVADNLLVLKFVEDNLDIYRYLRIVKMRGSAHDSALRRLDFANDALTLS